MDEILQVTLLYDFYGELLTQKQKLVYEMYYQNDLSLSEIAQELSISRQAVRDQLKRTEKILEEYEKKLCLVERFMAQKRAAKRIEEIIREMEKDEKLTQKVFVGIEKIKEITNEILD